MTNSELTDWFQRLDTSAGALKVSGSAIESKDFFAWRAEATVAIRSVFPLPHPVRVVWDRLVQFESTVFAADLAKLTGAFAAAANLVRERRLGTLIDAIRAQAEGDLLDQAESLLTAHHVAAAVIAGGALETHLRHLVTKNAFTVTGNGSIEAYNQAIARARNAGNEIYSANLGKYVTAWGGIRNDAAHDPGHFEHSVVDVKRMIEGIRDFIDRTK